jgi:hypothetical protein
MLAQSTAKTIFLLGSMAGWLLIGATLIYLGPVMADSCLHSALTHRWMETLGRSGYRPDLAILVGSVCLGIEIVANWIWYRPFSKKNKLICPKTAGGKFTHV